MFRFRYAQHFRLFEHGYPGVDHAHARVFEPHDLESEHTCAFDEQGELLAVSTATRADADALPAEWREWFKLDRLRPLGLERIVVSTRMVLRRDQRGSDLFQRFYEALISGYVKSGLLASLHYSRPGLLCRYEKLGHRIYAEPFNLPGGELRLPMLIAFNDVEYLQHVGAPAAALCLAHRERVPAAPVSALYAAAPELIESAFFSRLAPEEQGRYVAQRLNNAEAARALKALHWAAPVRVQAGQTLNAALAEQQLCCLLSGRVCEESAAGERRLGPGDFLGAGLRGAESELSARAETPAELLVFDSGLVRRALESFTPSTKPEEIWSALASANGVCRANSAPRPNNPQEGAPCGKSS